MSALEVWKNDRIVTMLLVNEDTNEAVKECGGIEAATVAIDVFAALEKHKELENDTKRTY